MKFDEVVINNERVFLKKDILGWRVVEPIFIDGKFIWKNFVSRKGLVWLLFLLIIIGVGYLAFQEQFNNYREVMKNPCSFCVDCQVQVENLLKNYSGLKYNFPNLSKVVIQIGEEMSV